MFDKDAKAELDMLRKKHKGLLQPVVVVKFAQNPKTALHKHFCWDNRKAGHQHRLWQARELLQVYVTVIEGCCEAIRALVSLPSDRKNPGGGYRHIEDVMLHAELREQLLNQALAEFNRLREKYRQLKELSGIFAAISKAEKKHGKEKPT